MSRRCESDVLQLTMILALAGATLGGCARGPDYIRPELNVVVPDRFVSEASTRAAADSVRERSWRWWAAFGDATLDELVDESLQHNLDLARAAARVLESRALLTGSKAAQWPAIEIGGDATRSKFTRAQFGGTGSVYNTLYGATASASYELDLWGRLSRAKEASYANLLASEEDRRTVQQTLVADVVRAWLEIGELICQLELSERTIANYEQNLQIVSRRYERGLAPPVDIRLARQNLMAARALRPQWTQDLATARRRLEILVGRYPAGTVGAERSDCAACRPLAEMNPVPTGLPADLLQRRPDVLAAEMRLRAANARIGEAKAGLYPRISLTGSSGYRAAELDQLFEQTSSIWSLIGRLATPILNRGAQQSQVQAAEARTAEAAGAYRSTVLNAFREVETALDTELAQAERRQWLQRSAEEARRALVLAEERYRRGLDNQLLILDTQRRLYQAESDLIRTERVYRASRVNLILALGGPWEEPAPVQLSRTKPGAPR